MNNDNNAEEPDYADQLLSIKKRSTHIRSVMLTLPTWITPNGVTVFRSLLVVPVIALLRTGHYWAALVTLAVAMILDFVDGALAEARNQSTTLGKFLDPLGDKILICGTLIGLCDLIQNVAIIPITIAICTFATLLTVYRVIQMAKQKKGAPEPAIAANAFGKIKLITESLGVLVMILGLALAVPWLVQFGMLGLLVAIACAFLSFRNQVMQHIKID